jgi:non-specific protein-tyrosine kinase
METNRHIRVVWRYRWWLLIFAIAAAAAAYGVSTQLEKSYRGEALVRITPAQQATGGFISEVSLQQLAEGYAELGRSPAALERAREKVPGTVSEQALRDAVTVDPGEGGVISVTADSRNRESVAPYANALAAALAAEIDRTNERDRQAVLDRITDRVEAIRKEVDAGVPPETRTALEQEVAALQVQAAGVRSRPSDTASVISAATTPSSPESPKPAFNAAFTFLVALLLGAAIAYLRSALSNRYESGAEAAEDLGLPLLSEVPREKDDDAAAVREAFRALRTNAEFALSTHPSSGRSSPQAASPGPSSGGLRARSGFRRFRQAPSPAAAAAEARSQGPVLLVTSPEAGTGKTFVTSNLARALSADGLEVLAIDSDLRRPTLHKRYDIPRAPGLSDLLSTADSAAKANGMLRRIESDRDGGVAGGSLRALSAGPPLEQSSEALATERMAHLVEQLAGQHDIVALDSPPVLAAVDATVLSRYADGVVLVVDARQTPRRAARRAAQALKAVDARLVGVVFNSAPEADTAYYGYDITQE